MTPCEPQHPERFPALLRLTRQRAAAAVAVHRSLHKQRHDTEFAVLSKDELGLAGRTDYAQTITHIWEKFALSERMVLTMSDYIECIDGMEPQVTRPMPLRIPDIVYAHFGSRFHEPGGTNSGPAIEGLYLWRTAEFGEPTCVYMVTCRASSKEARTMTLGELTIEKTRIAIGTVDIDETIDDTLDGVIGDPSVRAAMGNSMVKDALNRTIALFHHPGEFPAKRCDPKSFDRSPQF